MKIEHPVMQRGKANVIIDAQWGSTGKGKLAGYLCETERPDLVICDYMPNAGHTYVSDKHVVHTVCQIPVAACFGIPCLIGPHAAINVELFLREVEKYADPKAIFVHPLASVIHEDDRNAEQLYAGRIANTAKGGHSSASKKMLRSYAVRLARDEKVLKPFLADAHRIAQDAIGSGQTILVETAQGFDLGLNHGHTYPFVTGRDCLVGRAIDNAGLPIQSVGSIIACFREHPIRVGNTADGHSGPSYDDQVETTWEKLAEESGLHIQAEMTTVTKRIRRVFTFSQMQMSKFFRYVRPTHGFYNFVNYIRPQARDERIKWMRQFCRKNGCDLWAVGTGPGQWDVEILPRTKDES